MAIKIRHAGCHTSMTLAATVGAVLAITGTAQAQSTAAAQASAAKACERQVSIGPAPLRRLTRLEYINTARDLLGAVTVDAERFPEEGGSGFDNNVDLAVATRIHAQKYMSTAESLAAQAVADLPRLLGCIPTRDETACLKGFIKRFGLRAWRRPLSAQEEVSLSAFFAEQRQSHSLSDAVALLVMALLESPHFLYRVEVGISPPQGSVVNTVRLTDWEVASRLSYFFWATMPDARLFALAHANQLHTRAQVRRAAQWMVRDERARATLRRFHEQWLGLPLLDRLQKDKAHFPTWDKTVPVLMKAQFDRFMDHVLWQQDGRLGTLLTTKTTFLNEPLAGFLGIKGVRGPDWQRVIYAGPPLAGIFTLPAFLAMQANVEETSPIKRGIFVREQLLCQIPPPPPPNLMMNMLPPATAELVTVRERLEEHKLGFGCAKCHELFDPLGFAFEDYDAAGVHRTQERGHSLDTTGEVVQSDVDGPFDNGRQLAQRLANSEMVRTCFVKQWFRFAFARTESDADLCTLATMNAAFKKKNYRIVDLMLAVVQTDAFLYLPVTQPSLASLPKALQ